MSLAYTRGKGTGWDNPHGIRSEERPRFISHPQSGPDEASHDSPKNPRASAYVKHSGNAKPQEPAFLRRRPSISREAPRMAGHMHPRPWTTCGAPGKKEIPNQGNAFHRTWISDCGVSGRPLTHPTIEFGVDAPGSTPFRQAALDNKATNRAQSEPRRWTRASMREFYAKTEEDMASRKCHDEMFAHGANAKYWTHLLNGGATAGGQEKLDMAPKRQSGQHLKSGLYKGKFSNIQHKQIILRARRKPYESEQEVDKRPAFDNRVKDDMMKTNEQSDRDFAAANLSLFNPSMTRSCPQMGAEFVHR